ncbi:MAG TPA: malic enzyme-like NAD(P)-binding protein [Flexilinea sp.]|nr:malic enzyme-like NAD(P)-binding protein [Flexilinea sp.]
MANITKEDALTYHQLNGVPGKISVVPSKPLETFIDLSLAYTPGVAFPVLEIAEKPETVYDYTDKGNLVAVISNGTAILGLGNRGSLASKPVMEGKGVLFKKFADIDVFDIEVDTTDKERFIDTVAAIGNTFGGINLEDIKAPECFEIEQRLQQMLSIPVFHDDQHGTAIILGAALLNALEIVNKKIERVKIVINGAGAAGISCARHLIRLGVKRENLFLCDSTGLVYKGRQYHMNPQKEEFANGDHPAKLDEVIRDADVFCGLSTADVLTGEMIKTMAKDPCIFGMANPNPEIKYEIAREARPDAIIATGRSDYPNQINNVLGFPYIFRGALDVRASKINEEMKLAASYALAELAHLPVPDYVLKAYEIPSLEFGRDYIVPKAFDKRAKWKVSAAIAEAAMKSGVAGIQIDLETYQKRLGK